MLTPMPVALVHGRSPGSEPTYVEELVEVLRVIGAAAYVAVALSSDLNALY